MEEAINAFTEHYQNNLNEAVPPDPTMIESLLLNPVNINQADYKRLTDLFFLTEYQIKSLLNYRSKYKKIHSIKELGYIYGFDHSLAQMMSAVVVLDHQYGHTISWDKALRNPRQLLIARNIVKTEKAKGYKTGETKGYIGSPHHLYQRYQYYFPSKYYGGFTMEKDPGETIKTGPDYISGYLKIEDLGWARTAILGDYHVSCGQGLILGAGFTLDKTGQVLSGNRIRNGIYRHTSTAENHFFRGGAIEIERQNFWLTLFASHKKMDANLEYTTKDKTKILSLPTNGLHNTQTTLDNKNQLPESFLGLDISIRKAKYELGFTGIFHDYHFPFKRKEAPRDLYRFHQQKYTNKGFHYKWFEKNMVVFGETAFHQSTSWATINGLSANLKGNIKTMLIFRYFSPGYFSAYGNPFGGGRNEKGLYTGLHYQFRPKWTIQGFYDVTRHLWWHYRTNGRTTDREYFLRLKYHRFKKLTTYLQYKSNLKPLNHSGIALIDYPINRDQQLFRFHTDYLLTKKTRFQFRFDYHHFRHQEKEEGVMFYAGLKWNIKRPDLTFNTRIALFRTDGYNSRIYSYENNLLYRFLIPAFYDEGTRSYLMVKWRITKGIDWWGRISRTFYYHLNESGSGLNQIKGPKQTEISTQIMIRL
ncbi:MAG: hypothetical protein ACOC2F_06195 [Bacteroidota bacterium]